MGEAIALVYVFSLTSWSTVLGYVSLKLDKEMGGTVEWTGLNLVCDIIHSWLPW